MKSGARAMTTVVLNLDGSRVTKVAESLVSLARTTASNEEEQGNQNEGANGQGGRVLMCTRSSGRLDGVAGSSGATVRVLHTVGVLERAAWTMMEWPLQRPHFRLPTAPPELGRHDSATARSSNEHWAAQVLFEAAASGMHNPGSKRYSTLHQESGLELCIFSAASGRSTPSMKLRSRPPPLKHRCCCCCCSGGHTCLALVNSASRVHVWSSCSSTAAHV